MCISRFQNCADGAKDPPKPAVPIVRCCLNSKYISLRLGSPCTVTVSGYSVGLTNVLASYPVEAGEAVIAQERTYRLSSACEKILDHGGNLCDNSVMFSMERK